MTSNNVRIEELQVVENVNGDIVKFSDARTFFKTEIKEAYFTKINYQKVKGWNKHHTFTCRLLVIAGKVSFLVKRQFDDAPQKFVIECDPVTAITIPPQTWFAFKGLDAPQNVILNLLDGFHDPAEVSKSDISVEEISKFYGYDD